MSNQSVAHMADELITQGVDEFRMASAKTATGIIEQGLAILKIKEGCNQKQGGSDFPEVAMRLLGLSKGMASKLVTIGAAAEKLFPVGNTLPSESITTLYQISRMDEATIADKVERGVINPTATRDQVLEQVRVGKEKTYKKGSEPASTGESVSEVFTSLNKKDQDILNAHMEKVKNEFKAEVKAEREKVREDKDKVDKTRQILSEAKAKVQHPFTRDEYKLILGMLHPDRHPGNEVRSQRAFDVFKRIEFICKKNQPKG